MGNLDKAYTLDDVVRVTIYALIIFISSLIFFVLITVILTHPQLRRCFRNHQLISAALGGIVFSLLVRPGTINVDLYINLAPPKEYCNLFYFLSDFEVVFLPVTLLLMTTMTIVAEKGDMEDKLKWWHKGGILIGPWMISGIFAVFRRYVLLYDDSYGNQYRPPIYYKGCEHGYVLGINRGSVITWVITLCGLTVSLFLALVVLLVRHCYTNCPRNEPVNTLELAPIEQQPSETSVVKAPSTQWRRVAMVTVVDIMMIVVATLNVCLKDMVVLETTFQWCFSLVEMFMAFVAMIALPDINTVVMELYCHRKRKLERKKKAEDAVVKPPTSSRDRQRHSIQEEAHVEELRS